LSEENRLMQLVWSVCVCVRAPPLTFQPVERFSLKFMWTL
jgi:hypothetical protein